jgi:hypothetical protein
VSPTSNSPLDARLTALVQRAVKNAPVLDIHTHLYDPAFGGLMLWGLDDLLVYHYLVAEALRVSPMTPEAFWALPKPRQAEMIWDELFRQRSPLSEACRGVLTTLQRLGLDARRGDLAKLRRWFAAWKPRPYAEHCLNLARVRQVFMTNSPFDAEERKVWDAGFKRSERFLAALRIDPLLLDWPSARRELARQGFSVRTALDAHSFAGIRRFLDSWTRRLDARYVMVSLPPDFSYPARSNCARALDGAVLPRCREAGQPLALMLGVRRAVNPRLRLAGDGVGRSDLSALANLCAAHPDTKFLVTVLARENQHELCVLARKFSNLHVFGCWWFTNVPSIAEEMTRMRLELLGTSFTAQHSDARVLDQLIYKWDHTRHVLARVLADHYAAIARAGWQPTAAELERDVGQLLGGGFLRFAGAPRLGLD